MPKVIDIYIFDTCDSQSCIVLHKLLIQFHTTSTDVSQDGIMRKISLFIRYFVTFQIVLEGVIKSGSRGEIAVDEILLQEGKCQTESE